MKKVLWVIVCLMTMVVSANAQNELKLVKTDYKSTIPFDCVMLMYDNEKFSKTKGTITIDYSYYEELGNSLSIKISIGGKTTINYFKDVFFLVKKDDKENKKIYVIYDNFRDPLFTLLPINEDMANSFNINRTYTFSIDNGVLLE